MTRKYGHPQYSDDQKYIMRIHPKEWDQQDPELVMLECERRIYKGKDLKYYEELRGRAVTRFLDDFIDDKGKLTAKYASRVHKSETIKRLKRGEFNKLGQQWEPYFRMWAYPEIFEVISKLGDMKQHWNNLTLKEGKLRGDVGKLRKEWMLNGKAASIAIQYGLKGQHRKLTTEYTARA